MSSIVYTKTVLDGTGKMGVLKPMDDGYYSMPFGALNVFNSAGQWYPLDYAKKHFDNSSIMQRRIKDGAMRAEYGHPKKLPGMTQMEYKQRIMQIYEDMICAHIRSVTLDYDNYKDDHGRPIVAIIGEFKPQGPYGDHLRESLESKDEGVCFSIRSFTRDVIQGNTYNKLLEEIFTWDYVNEPGIKQAKKWNALTLESLDLSLPFTVQDFELIMDDMKCGGMAMESNMEMTAELIDKLKAPKDAVIIPNWLNL